MQASQCGNRIRKVFRVAIETRSKARREPRADRLVKSIIKEVR